MTDHAPENVPNAPMSAEEWDTRYRESDRIWSGNPNVALVREMSDAAPGRALELGCGEGADAVWLARRGWTVTAVDISEVALERAAQHAAEAGLAASITFEKRDLSSGPEAFPEGEFELVTAAFLHSRGDFPREAILRRAAGAVAPGGVLLVVGHSGMAPWEEANREGEHGHGHHHEGVELPSPAEVLESLQLDESAWEVLECSEHDRTQTGPDGDTHHRTDSTVKVRRSA